MDIYESLENPLPNLVVSLSEIVIEAKDTYEVDFNIKNTKGGLLEGQIVSPTKSLTFSPQKWTGNRQTIKCKFEANTADGWKPGDVRTFEVLVLSNGGEITIPVTIRLAKMSITTDEGIVIVNLQDFYSYSLTYPESARKLFVNSEFHMLLLAMKFPYVEAYELLIKEANRALAMDNFLILAGLKSQTKLIVSQSTIEHKSDNDNIIKGKFEIEKSDNGYAEATITTLKNVPWLTITADNFTVNYSINPSRIKTRYAQEQIIIKVSDVEEDEVTVDIIFKKATPIRAWLPKEGYSLQDEGFLIIENTVDQPLEVELFCKEPFVRMSEKKYKVDKELKVPFTIKRSALQSAQMLLRKVPSLTAEIEVSTNYGGKNFKKTLTLTAGEW